jgi:hypothetical protein
VTAGRERGASGFEDASLRQRARLVQLVELDERLDGTSFLGEGLGQQQAYGVVVRSCVERAAQPVNSLRHDPSCRTSGAATAARPS